MAQPRRAQPLTPPVGACGRQGATRLGLREERSFYIGKLATRQYFLRSELPRFKQPLLPTGATDPSPWPASISSIFPSSRLL
jgi:hypothetical protein